jgi:phosphohistidine swiveling domain-containing protein
MKGIKKILFVHRPERPVNPLFEAILRQTVLSDSVLSTAGVSVDSAEIGLPEDDITEWKQPLPEIQSVLDSLGFQGYSYRSKNVRLQAHLIDWADLILVPEAGAEDLLCLFSHEAWSKTIDIKDYCGKNHGESTDKLSDGKSPASEDDYLSIATTFKMLIPELLNRIKDSYASHLIVKGKVLYHFASDSFSPIVIGNASVVRCGEDMMKFIPGNILVVDRLDKKPGKPWTEEEIKIKLAEMMAKLKPIEKGEKMIKSEKIEISHNHANEKANTTKVKKVNAATISDIKGVVCSRGVDIGIYDIPYLYSCIGATEYIKDNQLIVVDSIRGEVYDASSLQSA